MTATNTSKPENAAAPKIETEEVIMALAQMGHDPSVKHAQSLCQRIDAGALAQVSDRSAALRDAIQQALQTPFPTATPPSIDLAGEALVVYDWDSLTEMPDYEGVAKDRRTGSLVLTTLDSGTRNIAFLQATTVEQAAIEAEALKAKLGEIEWAYYSPATHSVIDVIRPDGLTYWGSQSYAQVVARYPEVVKISIERAVDLHAAIYLDEPVKHISKQDFWDALEVLPPEKWRGDGNTESFMMSEHLSGNITGIYVRIGADYLRLNGRTAMTHDDIVARARTALPAITQEASQEASM